LLGVALSGVAVATWPQDSAAPDSPVNLQVLPADIAPRSLGRLMKRYEQELGVACSYCHVENRDTGKLDYASDENPKKHTARIMIAMLEDINERHLAQLGGDQRYGGAVTCGSCHQGRANPQPYEARAR
jgi:hypothetical protein